MAWTTPTDRTTGYTVTSADWNIVEDDLTFLYGDTAWTNVASFTNSWSNAAGVTTRYRLAGRIVTINGEVTGGTLGSIAFTLPAAYRPTQQFHFASVANNAFGMFFVDTGGNVVPQLGSATNHFLDCTFSVG